MTQRIRTVAILGAGFCGTVVAVNLLRLQRGPLRIVLVDDAPLARGLAYAAHDYPYLLNVPAGRMSASSHSPLEFLHFAQQRLPAATAADFLPRALYGDYLEWLLQSAERDASSQVHLERMCTRAQRLAPTGGSPSWSVELADGRLLTAEQVVLALGNPPPARVRGCEALEGSERYIEDPWRVPAAFHSGETLLVVGTGLTAWDIILAGLDAAQGRAVVHAISRHGLLAHPQGALNHAECLADPRALLAAASFSVRHLLRSVRDWVERLQSRGADWRDALTALRSLAPALWQRLPLRERQRFLRHLRTYWDVHRHRLPPQTQRALDGLRNTQRLHLHAGRILHCRLVGRRIGVTWRPRGGHDASTMYVDRVINCTGPDYNAERSPDPLLRSMLAQGLARADELGLGLRTSTYGALIDAHGRAANELYYVGPMLRATHWESTAVQELRGHAERLAHELAAKSIDPSFALRLQGQRL